MKVKINNPFFGMTGVYNANITADSDTSCSGKPVLFVCGMSVTPHETTLAEYQYLDANDDEMIMLQKAGYILQGGNS